MVDGEFELMPLSLISKTTATTYVLRYPDGGLGWALCTVNDETGELNIQSDWGSWSHRWNAHPDSLGAKSLTAFIADRASVDYLARKLQNEGTTGRQWSAEATVRALQYVLRERRLEDGRAQLEGRLDSDDMEGGKPLRHLMSDYTDEGLPIFSHKRPYEYRNGRPWNPYDRLHFLTCADARRIWDSLDSLATEFYNSPSGELFYHEVLNIDGFLDYVTDEPWQYGMTEQTPGDKALREQILPPLMAACAEEMSTDSKGEK
jgi:hypothetical protein